MRLNLFKVTDVHHFRFFYIPFQVDKVAYIEKGLLQETVGNARAERFNCVHKLKKLTPEKNIWAL